MSMPANYLEKRERLNELLVRMNVPRILFNQMRELNKFIAFNRATNQDADEALKLIYEISPVTLPRFSSLVVKQRN